MSILHKVILPIAVVVATCINVAAQSSGSGQLAYFLSGDTIMCDEGILNLSIAVNSSEEFDISYTIVYESNNRTQEHNATRKRATYNVYNDQEIAIDMNGCEKHERCLVILNSITFSSKTDINDTISVDIWATPKAKILNSDRECGYHTTLLADDSWSDVSSYSWTTTAGTLSDENTQKCAIKLVDEVETTFTAHLTESTGNGTCTSEATKDITLVGSPKGSIYLNDAGVVDSIRICSSITDDAAFDFDGYFDLSGNEPFDVYLANGEKYSDVVSGVTNHPMRATEQLTLRIDSIMDNNGCWAEADDLSGSIEIVDRKPVPTTPTDTLSFEGRDAQLTVSKGGEDNYSYWQLAEGYKDYDVRALYGNDNGMSSTMHLRTNITGLVGIDYNEVNVEEGLENCPSDTYTVYVTGTATVNAPNGFSPNGDGKNDRLVIESIPPENHIMVVDGKGDIVFEQDDYRNDWDAAGVGDGYYVYVFTAKDFKTIKETLVIKRSK